MIFIIALVGMTMITMQTGNDTYMNKNSAEGIVNNEYTNTFNADALILIIKTSDPLSPAVLTYMDRLEADIRQQQHVAGASSVVDILKSENNGILPQSTGEISALVNQMPSAVKATAVPSNVLTLMEVPLDPGLSDATEASVLNTVQLAVDQSNPPAGRDRGGLRYSCVHSADESGHGIPDGGPDWGRHDPDGASSWACSSPTSVTGSSRSCS